MFPCVSLSVCVCVTVCLYVTDDVIHYVSSDLLLIRMFSNVPSSCQQQQQLLLLLLLLHIVQIISRTSSFTCQCAVYLCNNFLAKARDIAALLHNAPICSNVS